MERPLERIRSVADYQFGKGVGVKLFPDDVEVLYSKRTGRIRYVYFQGKRLATLRPTDGMFSLSVLGAMRIAHNASYAKYFVTVRNDVSKFIAEGSDVFAAHVIGVGESVHPKDEVIVVDETLRVLAVGRAVLSSEEMKAFKAGVAVKVRRGCMEES